MVYELLIAFGTQLASLFTMNVVVQNLLRLQSLEFGEVKNVGGEAEQLRGQIPAPILGHYDRLRVRGKKGISLVRNQVCTGCHMHVPIGKITVLMRESDIQLCDNCGRYLYLADASASPAVADPVVASQPAEKPAEKKTSKPRKRKVAAAAV
jgi:C4-type zinc ribbon domain